MSAAQEFSIPVFFLLGKNLTEAARDSISDVIAGGASIKAKLEAAALGGTSNFVPDAKVETVTVAGIDYLSLTFTVNVITDGAPALKDIMDTLAARLKGADYKNVYAFPTSPMQIPGVVVGYPTNIDLQVTFG